MNEKVLPLNLRFCKICGRPRNTLRECHEHMVAIHPVEAMENFQRAMKEFEQERRIKTTMKWEKRKQERTRC